TGDVCTVEMRPAEPKLAARFRAGDHPVSPSIGEALLEDIERHRSVLRVTPSEDAGGEEALVALVRCADGLVNAGALAVWCPSSGAAHSADRWQELAKDLAATGDDPALRREVLYRTLVRPLFRDGDRWRTDGMVLLDGPDVAVPSYVADVVAMDLVGRV